ncbi:MAG: PilZ domain-containing protein [Candidatus Omnitrophota bacterium]
MKVFKYLAKKNIGTVIESIVYAESHEEATEKIKDMGYKPEKIEALAIADKRIYERLDIELKVLYSVFKPGKAKTQPQFSGTTKNISAGGLFFKTTKELLPGAVIDIILILPKNYGTFQCLAKIVRVNSKTDDLYEAAVSFLDLPQDDCLKINKFVIKSNRRY